MTILDKLFGRKTKTNSSGNEEVQNIESDSAKLIGQALRILDDHIDVTRNLWVFKESGSGGKSMEAVKILKQASSDEPDNAHLRFTYITALPIAAQFQTAQDELKTFMGSFPSYSLAHYLSESWEEGPLSPGVFRYPEWQATTSVLPAYYRGTSGMALWPARKGIYPRAVLLEKDDEGWWTREKLRDLKVEVAIVLSPGRPNIAAIYRKCSGPGLDRPDHNEGITVLDRPKDAPLVVALAFLCEQKSLDVVIVDRNDKILFNEQIEISLAMRSTLDKVRAVLLETRGRDFSESESKVAHHRYQESAGDIGAIMARLF